MHIADVFNQKTTQLSFEFFPPKSEESSKQLFDNIQNLTSIDPAYVSVTYGAGGSTRDLTQDLILRIKKETSLTVVSHLTCVGASKDDIKKILSEYQKNKIENIMALRGDPPAGTKDFVPNADGFKYAAELVTFIKKNFPQMGIGVAGFAEGHPATPNRLRELEYLKMKVDAGADYICTQLFFDNNDFFDFVERCRLLKIEVPIIAGIMPITTRKGLERIAELAQGARIPAKLLKALERTKDNSSFQKVGIHWATEQVRDLLDKNVSGIHFYTLNKSQPTLEVCKALGITSGKNID